MSGLTDALVVGQSFIDKDEDAIAALTTGTATAEQCAVAINLMLASLKSNDYLKKD